MSMLCRVPRRTFLNKLLRAGASGGNQRKTQKWQKIVQHPLPTLYRAVAEVERYSEFLPWCTSSTVLERGDDSLQTEVAVGYSTLQASFASKVELVPLKRVHAVSMPNEYIEHLSFTWDFGDLSGQRSCRVDLTLDFSLRNAEHTIMWELAQDKIISEYVRCFSERCVALEAESSAATPGARY